ncbi:MlaA family lipoprotein [Pseudooceanicola sp. 502str34]|uniref:MlaA family lipoprotein n=1 Tax=Maritimibacter alkaliphilus TaxID=404236 RepID=UPI0021BD09F4|nr:VacJ family lipoprotein [Maritimibacter alkaliphilus]
MYRILALTSLLAIAACAAPPEEVSRGGVYDPYEENNRQTHEFNKSVDRAFLRPVGTTYSKVMPDGLELAVNNAAENLRLPGYVVNSLLQFDIADAARNTFRFVVNSTLGVGGVGDAAQDLFGVDPKQTDFGETLYVWGFNEGAYVELPLFGPSTSRDAWGRAVDFFTDPLGFALSPPESYVSTVGWGLTQLSNRGRYASSYDDLLYESADSYAQARILYLQNRRYELGYSVGGGAGGESDPYDDPYGDPYDETAAGAAPAPVASADPYYEDPYDDPSL